MSPFADNLPPSEDDLARGIAEGELRLHYQPLVEAHSKRVAGFEALVRWQHPERGLLSPALFLPIAEGSELITPLTRWVFDEALPQCRRWWSAGHGIHVAVNLSAKLLSAEDLTARVMERIDAHQLSPQALTLEITESALADNPDLATEHLRELRRLGVKLSVDDFGTGYTSLALLRRFEFDELKIDGSFVSSMLRSPTDSAIVHSILELGHRLGLSVVAECVEDGETAQLLAELGCDVLQGFYFGRPGPADEAERWLEETAAEENSSSPRGAIAAPIPKSEPKRLKTLRDLDILDTEPEPEFDDVAKLAATICGTPVALVSFVDADRQWFKSAFGIDVRETDRDSAFCAHAILHDSVMVVPDARRDQRFRDNPFVGGAPHIAFYAGAPLQTQEGLALGTVCVIDSKPRSMTDQQRHALESLAQIVMGRLYSRRNELILRRLSVSLMTLSQLHDPSDAALAADTIVSAGRELLAADGVSLMLAESAGAVVFRSLGVSADNAGKNAAQSVIIDRRSDLATIMAMDSKAPVFIAEAPGSELLDQSLVSTLGAQSVLHVPIVNESGPAGVLLAWWNEPQPQLDATRRDASILLAAEAGTMLSRHQALTALRRAAETDMLTGLSNRRACMEQLRLMPSDSAIILLDLDHFKSINDQFGHQVGDNLLRTFAAHLRAVVRNEDLVCRWGGEEFLIALPGGGVEAGRDVLERLRRSWRSPVAMTTFSAGLVTLGMTENPGAALNRADAALYAAKEAGRDRDHLSLEAVG